MPKSLISTANCSLDAPSWLRHLRLIAMGIFIAVASIACQFNTIEEIKIEEPLVVDYSMPIGYYTISVEDMLESLNLVPVDISYIPQGTNLFLAGGQYYQTPAHFDTLVTFEFDLNPTEEYLDNIRYFNFRLNFKNSSHATITLQLYLRGKNASTPIDSVFRQGPFTIKGGALDQNNRVIPVQIWRHDEPFPNDQISNLVNVTHLDAKVRFAFPQVPLPPVDYQSSELLWNQMGVKTGLTITADEL
jgi:hypothetical protein